MKPQESNPGVHAFAQQVCMGNKEALVTCDLFYRLAHGLDDLIDTREDGRPTMSSEAIIELWITTAMFYNSPFYVAHRDLLFGTILGITNTWADSVAWEKDPMEHRRTIANVLRTCGDDFFFMVAAIIGGWKHMRAVSPIIREADFLRQNDPEHLRVEGK